MVVVVLQSNNVGVWEFEEIALERVSIDFNKQYIYKLSVSVVDNYINYSLDNQNNIISSHLLFFKNCCQTQLCTTFIKVHSTTHIGLARIKCNSNSAYM